MPVTNAPSLWLDHFPWPKPEMHKYDRGAAIIVGGASQCTGAAKLAAYSALRIGAGIVQVACPASALPIYASSMMSVMTTVVKDDDAYKELLENDKHTAFLVGPGNGVHDTTLNRTLATLTSGIPCVIDADALTVFHEDPDKLFDKTHPASILTPHEGEFYSIFDISGDRVSRATEAAKMSNAIIVLKGSETVIAHPDGTITLNQQSTPWLATAGSGDVLAGIITGLLAQGVAPYTAATMGTWIHSKAANQIGPGLISEDLLHGIQQTIKQLSC